MTTHRRRSGVACLLLAASLGFAQQPSDPGSRSKPEPTYSNTAYGVHERQVLDFWQADSPGPSPLAVYIHGGGFRGGSKGSLNPRILNALLAAGISVAAIHYRLVPNDPLPAAHHDARRAIQFLRSKADDWNIDGQRVGAFGGSAGAQLCMYLAFHDDMAQPHADEPVARESTRLTCVATSGGQTTMDLGWWMTHIPGYAEPHRPSSEYFGVASPDQQLAIIEHISALSLISQDDPPIFMSYRMSPGEAAPDNPGEANGWRVHHVGFGVALKKRMDGLGIESHLRFPGSRTQYRSLVEFFAAKLGR